MSAERDLAIARAVLDWCKLVQNEHGLIGKLTDDNLREWIAAVDASLGGEVGDSHAPAPVLDGAAEEGAGCAPTRDPALHPESRPAQAAEPPSDLLASLSLAYQQMYAGILPADKIEESARWLERFILPYLDQAARAEQQRAAGIMQIAHRLALQDSYRGSDVMGAVIGYLAEAEAAQKGDG